MKSLLIPLFFLFCFVHHLQSQITVTNAQELQNALDDQNADRDITIEGIIYGRFVVNRSGSIAEPIRIHGGTISGINVNDSGLEFALLSVNNQSNIYIENITFENNYTQGAKGIYVTTEQGNSNSLQNIYIDSCIIRNIGWSDDNTQDPTTNPSGTGQAHGILVTGRTANTIMNVNITNNVLSDIVAGNSEALTINGNVDGFLVQANTIHDITNIGIDIAGGFGVGPSGLDQARNGKVIENTVYNCRRPTSVSGVHEPAGIYVDGGANVEISRNRSYQNGQGFSIGREQIGETTNITMINNLSYSNAENGLVFGANNGIVKDSAVRNNTFYNNGADLPSGEKRSGISVQITENCSITNNIIYETRTNMYGISKFYGGNIPNVAYNLVHVLDEHRNLVGVGNNPNGLSVVPDFDVNSDFLPNANSPVIDTGDSTGISSEETDFSGAFRIAGASVDIGAREYNSMLHVENYSPLEIVIFPNPTNNFLHIKDIQLTTSKIFIYDMLGKLHLKTEYHTENDLLNIENLKSGSYILILYNDTSKHITKFIKN